MIQKFEVIDFRQTYTIPKESDFLSVRVNKPKGNVALYLAVDPKIKAKETRTFWLVAVGRTIPHDSTYLGTVEQDGMHFHLFELLNRHHKRKILN